MMPDEMRLFEVIAHNGQQVLQVLTVYVAPEAAPSPCVCRSPHLTPQIMSVELLRPLVREYFTLKGPFFR